MYDNKVKFNKKGNKKLLTKEEETILAKAIDKARLRDEHGNKDHKNLWDLSKDAKTLKEAKKAREKLIMSNLRLVTSIAKKYQGRGIEFEDLIQEGYIGLMFGIDRFDFNKDIRISTYCSWWIKQKISRLITEKSNLVRVKSHVQEVSRKLKVYKDNYYNKFGKEPNIDTISSELNCSKNIINLAERFLKKEKIIHIDHLLNEEDTESYHNLIPDKHVLSPFENLTNKELVSMIRKSLGNLPKRDEKILKLRFGIREKRE